ncbi:MAG: hypothetical protein M1822_002489 [Bathelium mastoideum]|nr:MAG: hypothetical protein M1822_002489 [Bathelium mastoideum]
MSHRAFMHSLLATAAMHAYIVGKASYYDIVHHKSLAVQEININLSDPVSRINDGNIAAVFSLLCVEESMLLPLMAQEGDGRDVASRQRLVHVSGLKRMIELRGGLTALDMNQCLRALIIWHVALHSVASFLPPYLPLPEFDPASDHAQEQPRRSSVRATESQMLKFCFDLGIDQSLASLLDDLSVLAAQLAHWLDDPQAPFEPLDLQTRGNMIQVRLLTKYTEAKSTSIPSPMENTLCLAALVFTVLVFQSRSTPAAQAVHQTALGQLLDSIQLTQPSEWAKMPNLLLWVLVIGTIGARESSRLPWFLNRLLFFCFDHQLEGVDRILKRIRPLLWVDQQLSGVFAELWNNAHAHVKDVLDKVDDR